MNEHHPVLVPRTKKDNESSRKVEVWHVINETADGGAWVKGQTEELVGSEVGYPMKHVTADGLSDDTQARLAEELAGGQIREYDVVERSVEPKKIGGEVMGVLDIEPVTPENKHAVTAEIASIIINETIAEIEKMIQNYYTRNEGTPRGLGIRLGVWAERLETEDKNAVLSRVDLEEMKEIAIRWQASKSLYFDNIPVSRVADLAASLRQQVK